MKKGVKRLFFAVAAIVLLSKIYRKKHQRNKVVFIDIEEVRDYKKNENNDTSTDDNYNILNAKQIVALQTKLNDFFVSGKLGNSQYFETTRNTFALFNFKKTVQLPLIVSGKYDVLTINAVKALQIFLNVTQNKNFAVDGIYSKEMDLTTGWQIYNM